MSFKPVRQEAGLLTLVLLLCGIFYVSGIHWGLNIEDRKALIFGPKALTRETVSSIQKVRETLYARLGMNVGAKIWETDKYALLVDRPDQEFFRINKAGHSPSEEILMAYSSYLLRSKHPDEQKIIVAISHFKPGKFEFHPHNFHYGGVFIYSLAALYKLSQVVGYLKLEKGPKYYYENPSEIRKFYLIGRIYTALAVLLIVLATFWIGKELGQGRAALFAALCIGLCPAAVVHSHVMKPHMLASFFALLTVLFAIKIYKSQESRWYKWSWACWGLATGATLPTGFIGLAIALGHMYSRDKRKWLKKLWDGRLWRPAWIGLAVYVLTNPYSVLDHKEFLQDVAYHSTHWNPFTFSSIALYSFIFTTLEGALGSPLFILMGAGMLLALTDLRREKLFITSLVWILLLLSSGLVGHTPENPENIRFSMHLLSMGILSAVEQYRRLLGDSLPPARRALILGMFWTCLIATAWHSLCYVRKFSLDTGDQAFSIQAGNWINANIPPKAGIGLSSYTPHVERTPPFQFMNYNLFAIRESAFQKDGKSLPDYFITETIFEEAEPSQAFKAHYRLLKYFGPGTKESTCGNLTNANFPVRVYKKAALPLPQPRKK